MNAESKVKHPEFAKLLVERMVKRGITQSDIAKVFNRSDGDMKSAMERVRLWMRGERMPRDEDLERLAKMLGISVAELRYGQAGKQRPGAMPELRGEHVTDEDEIRLLQAYRQLPEGWPRNALRAHAVELLEEFGKKGASNPFAKDGGTH